jgi:hypothetical protein
MNGFEEMPPSKERRGGRERERGRKGGEGGGGEGKRELSPLLASACSRHPSHVIACVCSHNPVVLLVLHLLRKNKHAHKQASKQASKTHARTHARIHTPARTPRAPPPAGVSPDGSGAPVHVRSKSLLPRRVSLPRCNRHITPRK